MLLFWVLEKVIAIVMAMILLALVVVGAQAVQLGRHMEKFTNLHRELGISYAQTESSTRSLRECTMDVDLRL